MTDNNNDTKVKLGPKKGIRKLERNRDGLTIKQLKFAEGLAAGLHFTDAFKAAYDTSRWALMSVYKKAHREQNHPKVAAKVAELKEQIRIATEAKLAGERLNSHNLPVVNEAAKARVAEVKRVLVTRDFVTEKLMDAYDGASQNGQYSASVGAMKTVAQLHGLISDNRDAAKQLTAIEQMTVDQLRDFILQELPQVGLSPSDVGLDFVSMNPNPKALN